MAPDNPKRSPATSSLVVRWRQEQTNNFLLPSSEREGGDKASQGGIASMMTTVLSTRYGHNPSTDTMVEIMAATYSLRNGAALVPAKTMRMLCASCKPLSGPSCPHV